MVILWPDIESGRDLVESDLDHMYVHSLSGSMCMSYCGESNVDLLFFRIILSKLSNCYAKYVMFSTCNLQLALPIKSPRYVINIVLNYTNISNYFFKIVIFLPVISNVYFRNFHLICPLITNCFDPL